LTTSAANAAAAALAALITSLGTFMDFSIAGSPLTTVKRKKSTTNNEIILVIGHCIYSLIFN